MARKAYTFPVIHIILQLWVLFARLNMMGNRSLGALAVLAALNALVAITLEYH